MKAANASETFVKGSNMYCYDLYKIEEDDPTLKDNILMSCFTYDGKRPKAEKILLVPTVVNVKNPNSPVFSYFPYKNDPAKKVDYSYSMKLIKNGTGNETKRILYFFGKFI